jgi:beta-N-acetylhexosaminidase
MGIVNDETAAFYDDYIDLICKKVEAGEIPEARIDESVERVLRLKENYGIMGLMDTERDFEVRVAEADATVGSDGHHAEEMAIARQAITLVKNEGALPLDGEGTYVLLVRTAAEAPGANFALSRLKEERLIADDACIVNLITGETVGSADSRTRVTVDYYYDYDTDEQHYTDEVREAIAVSDAVIVESIIFGAAALAPGATVRTSVEDAIADTHAVGAKFIHMSANLPYDVACYTDADAQVLSYMSTGTGIDPTDRSGGAGTPAYNANFLAALAAIFGGFEPSGTLPVNVPVMGTGEDGSAQFGDDTLFGRGFSLTYE